ncbi:hypothetical protein [Nocardia sp. NPDC057227]|uniref:hypothetical protein n=1 Tax=Nocardia sp. NPDC057227 TaxID=3346056 RepID=UPI003634D8AD
MAADQIGQRLVEAGVSELIEHPEQLLVRGLTADAVFHSAGVSNATYYRRYDHKKKYIADLLGGLVGRPVYSVPALLAEVELATLGSGRMDSAGLTALIARLFAAFTDDRQVSRRVLAHAFAGSNQSAAHSVRLDYRRRDELVLAVYDEVFVQRGLTLARPIKPAAFAVLVNALLEGFALRHRREPDAVTPQSVADALQAVLVALLDGTGTGHLSELPSAVPGPAAAVVPVLPVDPRAAVLAAARDEFTARGYFLAEVETIAAAAQVPRDLLVQLYPTKAHMIIGALRPQLDAIDQVVKDGLLFELPVEVIVEKYLYRLALMAAEYLPFTDALMLALAHDTYGESDRVRPLKKELDLPAIITPVIAKGVADGTFAAVDEPVEIAAEITNAIMLRCFTRRHLPSAQNAAIISALVLGGLRAR